MASLGKYAFLLGMLLAVVMGIVAGVMPFVISGSEGIILAVLIILGLIAGLLHNKDTHVNDLLIAIIALATVGLITVQQVSQLVPAVAPLVMGIFQNIVALAAPIALIIGLRQIWMIAYSKSK